MRRNQHNGAGHLLLGFAFLSSAACSGARGDGDIERSANPIFNGTEVTGLDADFNPAVNFRKPKSNQPHGVGTLIGESIVLTAAHVFDGFDPSATKACSTNSDCFSLICTNGVCAKDAVDAVHPTGSASTKSNVLLVAEYGSYVVPGPNGPENFPVDLAVAYLADPLGDSPIILPDLPCPAEPVDDWTTTIPPELECVSGILHTFTTNGADLFKTSSMRSAIFPVNGPDKTTGIHSIEFGPQPNGPGNLGQSIERGDSGAGCYAGGVQGGVLEVVVHRSHEFIPQGKTKVLLLPGEKEGYGQMLRPYCRWLSHIVPGAAAAQVHSQDGSLFAVQQQLEAPPAALDAAGGSVFAFEQQLDSDQYPDVIKLTSIANDTWALTLDRTELGIQSLEAVVPANSVIRAGALGNFTGTGQSLVLVANGGLLSAPVDSGPQPDITGTPGARYRMVSKARMNGDKVDDLVAQRTSGEIDVFLGGASGLVYNANVHPEVMRLDRDTLADFVWLNGDSGITTSSSIHGQSFRDVVPSSLDMSLVRVGVFQERDGAETGIQDIAVLGKDTANGGVLIWCESNGVGVVCNPAIEARFATGRNPIDFSVQDLDGDDFEDITVAYSGDDEPNRILFGKPTGLSSLPAAGTPRAFAKNRQGTDLGKAVFSDEGDTVNVSFVHQDHTQTGPFDLGMIFEFIFKVLSGNLTDDGEIPNALEAGALPFEDLVVLNGDTVFALISNQDGTFMLQDLDDASGVVDIALNDVNGDGIDDIEATKADGSVTVYAGGMDGVDPAGENFTGLPTPNSNDGKMLVLSGLGVDTVGATEARIKVRVGPEDTAALDQLSVEIFDGDNGGLHQFEEETSLLKTCYRLVTDRCGDGNAGNCAGGPTTPVVVAQSDSNALGDDVWDAIYEGPHVPAASLAGNGQAPFTYELRVFLSQDCNVLPTPGSTVQVATADAFKVRSNAMVSHALGEISFLGSDSDGEFGLPGFEYMRDTDYDGTFSLPIGVGSSTTEIQLKEADADDTDDSTPGSSQGANAEIQYRLLRPDGTEAPVAGADDGSPVTVVTNPSGNNDGVSDLDVETRIHTLASSTPGTWQWQWEGVMASNAVHVFAPLGSPTTHEILGARRLRARSTTTQQPYFWESEQSALSAALPIVLGFEAADGELEGQSLRVATLSEAAQVLSNPGATLQGELERQLLVAKLNRQRALAQDEDLSGALVYGRTIGVRTVFRRADAVVAGVDSLADDQALGELVDLLSSINLGEITYQFPGVPFPEEPMADDDGDGVMNLKDNCPSVANPLQGDQDDDRVGDACQVRPRSCVLERSDGSLEAFFEYESTLSFRALAVGSRNQVFVQNPGGDVLDVGQPMEFAEGLHTAFHVPLGGLTTVGWTLEGESVLASSESAVCSGRQLTFIDFAPQTVLFGTDSVVLSDHVSVTGSGGLGGVVSNGDISVGANTVVGHVLAGAHATIGSAAEVLGSAVTGLDLTVDGSASVPTTKTASLRPHVLDWIVDFASNTSDVIVGAGEVQHLAPGEYGDVVVDARAQLFLTEGVYRFRSLDVASQGGLNLVGEVTLHVAAALDHRGDTNLDAETRLTVGYFGDEPASVASSMRATVIAPNAELSIGSTRNSVYTGAFFARRLVVMPGTLVELSRR